MPRPPRRKLPRLVWVGALVIAASMLTAFGLDRPQFAVPDVPERALRIHAVERGEFVREVGGHGSLVPVRVRWLTADTAARVERLHVDVGASVEPDTVVVELSNPDLELQALQARSELAAARADLANLEAALETDRLGQKAVVASVQVEQRDAERTAQANETLAESSAVSRHEIARARDRADGLSSRLTIEQKRLGVLSKARAAQVAAQKARVEQLEAVAQWSERQIERLRVSAGERGVVGELAVEAGQWVTPGMVLGRVVQPEQLKAELRIPEVRARDLAVGQSATVDTHMGVVAGHISRIDAAVSEGRVTVDIELDEPLPSGVRPDQRVDGRIELERLSDVLWVRRPAHAEPHASIGLFVLGDDGIAHRVSVTLGRASTHAIEVIEGLSIGDRVIVSDTNAWNQVDRIRVQ